MFLKDSYNCISLVYLLNFLSNLHIPPWLGKTFKFVVLRLLENAIASQKYESSHIYSWYPSKTLPQVLIITPWREITNYQQAAFFQKPLSHFVQKLNSLAETKTFIVESTFPAQTDTMIWHIKQMIKLLKTSL